MGVLVICVGFVIRGCEYMGFVMCGVCMCACFGNLCTCIYCVFVLFVYVYLFLFVLSVLV